MPFVVKWWPGKPSKQKSPVNRKNTSFAALNKLKTKVYRAKAKYLNARQEASYGDKDSSDGLS